MVVVWGEGVLNDNGVEFPKVRGGGGRIRGCGFR